jgi:transposase
MVVETSCAIASVVREIGVSETSLSNWVRAYREDHAGDEPPLQLSDRARLRELEPENRELRQKNNSFQKQLRTSRRASVSDMYEFIDGGYAR